MLCHHCGKVFASTSTLSRHIRRNCYYSDYCVPKKIVRLADDSDGNVQLSKSVESNMTETKYFEGANESLRRKKIDREVVEELGNSVTKLRSAFKNRISSYRFKSAKKYIDPRDFLREIEGNVFDILSKYTQVFHTIKINCELFGSYRIPEKELYDVKSFNTKNKIITTSSDLKDIYKSFTEDIISKAEEFQERDSGWSLQEVLFLDVNINKYAPITAASYMRLPPQIMRTKAVLNIENEDNACFAWCIMAAIFRPTGKPGLITSYPHYSTLLNFKDIDFPVKLCDIPKFEVLNNISINVFGVESNWENGKKISEVVGPYYFTSERKATHVNLLFVTEDDGNSHYCLIRNMSRLVSRQLSKHQDRKHFCDGCLQYFKTKYILNEHVKNDCNHCYTKTPTRDVKVNKLGEQMPGNILKFLNYDKQMPVPFVIYADFESILKPIEYNEPNNMNSFTVKTVEHEPHSFGIYVKCNFDDKHSKYYSYRGSNVAEVFTQKLDQIVCQLYNYFFKDIKPMTPLSDYEKQLFDNSTACHICEKGFTGDEVKVQDHCHLSGRFRGPAHSKCNLNYKSPKFVPVFFHNLTNYDAHLFIKKLAMKGEPISVIAQNKEKYISFSKSILVEKSTDPKIQHVYMKLKFVDSFRFLSNALAKLSENLTSDQCIAVRKHFPLEKEFNLLRYKGIFPYNYVDSLAKLEERHMPSKDAFFDKISGEHVSQEEYDRAQKVWSTFNCSTLGEYSDLYLKTDVLLLADVFENFRTVCLKHYKLDPCQYLTSPSLSWDAMLRFTQVELELLTDIDMLHFFKRGIRGGISQCSKRKAIANNEFLPNYDCSKRKSYLLYLDATNLYGHSMSQALPTGDFRWLEKEEIEKFDCRRLEDDAAKGYVLEVDLEYPPELHSAHNDLPFCPENITPPNGAYPKLIPNLYDKKKYIIHYRNLKQCLKYGLKLKTIHRVLEFSQNAWLKPYIDLNTSLRNSASNAFERDLFKLLINAIFGKAMENVDKRQDVRLCSHWENKRGSIGAKTLIAKPYFKSSTVFEENLVAIQMDKICVTYDKPMYAGFCILDISKTVIYEFLYGFIKEKYGENAILLYTDTDSLILEIFTDNVYQDIKDNITHFDTSNYAKENIHNIPQMKSVIGRMKDEYAGTVLECFYGTGAKAYCIKGTDLMKKAKGISKSVIRNNLSLSDYIQVVETGGIVFRRMYIFKSELHNIYTELKNKIALSGQDDKRYVLPNNIETLAWGHFSINPQPTLSETDCNLDLLIDLAQTLEYSELDFDFNLDLL